MTLPAQQPLSILVVSDDAAVRNRVALALASGTDDVHHAATLDEAVTLATAGEVALAFVDVGSEGSATLALVHHLLAIHAETTVVALVPRTAVDLGIQALSLGARSLVMSPPNGDALLSAVSTVRSRREEALSLIETRAALGGLQRRTQLFDRVLDLAVHAGIDEALRTLCDAATELSGARGVAIFSALGGPLGCTRRAASGNARDYPDLALADDIRTEARARDARVLSAEVNGRVRGLVVVEDPRPGGDASLRGIADVAGVVLALESGEDQGGRGAIKDARGKVYTPAFLEDVAAREIAKARRHGRRVTLLTFSAESRARSRLEEIILDSVRRTDVLAAIDEATLCLLLPETTTTGAHQCRRRVVRALSGDRRAVQSASEKRLGRAQSSSLHVQGMPRVMGVGTATYPHDGAAFDRLLAISRRRAEDDTRSVARLYHLELLDLTEIADRLLERPLVDAGGRSPYPLDLAPEALPDLVLSALHEMRRGGATTVHVTHDPSTGCAAAVRAAVAGDDLAAASVYDVEAVHAQIAAAAVVGEMGAWVCCGRLVKGRFRGVHAFDPLLSDVLVECLRDTALSVAT